LSELLERLAASVHGVAALQRDRVRLAPFTCWIDPLRANKYLNFALPDNGTGEKARPVLGAVREAFAARQRNARVEIIEELCPELAAVLATEGWALSERIPVLTCTPDTLVAPPAPEGLEVTDIGVDAPHDTLWELLTAQHVAFGDEEDLTEDQVGIFRERRANDVVVAGMLEGRIVGTAQCTPACDGVVETVAVCTLAEYRGRGVAGTLTAAAVARAFDRGAELAWLSAADDGAERIYARAGFAVAGTQIAYDAP
jgi:GNAT superfamily N-acetyltransferase